MHRSILLGAFALAAVLLGLSPAPAAAVIRYVASNGVDSASCGTLTAPCRSITRAIERANAGDQIMVGPGRYGDVDRDTLFISPGDETSGNACGGCVTVAVTKRVTVQSSVGAAATVIEHASTIGSAVVLNADGATFGQKDKGFTVRSRAQGIEIGAKNVTVQDNRIIASSVGVKGDESLSDNATIVGNVISRSDAGVVVAAPGAVISDNVLESNGVGIAVADSAEHTVIDGNLVVNSASQGIIVAAAGTTIGHNALSGNGTTGVLVVAPGAVLTSNNFTGNGVGDVSNCGVSTVTLDPVKAERNYWGRTQGPGANPGDQVCGVGSVDTVPFLTRAVVIPNLTGR